VKHTGDGFLATFELSDLAVGAALEAVERLEDETSSALGIRVGIHRGATLHDAGDVFGLAVSLAARVMGQARPNQVLVTSAVRQACRLEDVSFTPRGITKLKGFDDPVELLEVSRP
jgi:class 3 adenylate cyclase